MIERLEGIRSDVMARSAKFLSQAIGEWYDDQERQEQGLPAKHPGDRVPSGQSDTHAAELWKKYKESRKK